MSYESVEAALQTQLNNVSDLKTALNDGTKIQSGFTSAAIIKFSRFTQEEVGMGGEHQINWYLDVDLYCKYKNDAETRNLIRDKMQAIIDRVNAYPHLGNASGVFNAIVMSGEMVPNVVQFGSFQCLMQRMTVKVDEDLSYSYAG